MSSLLWPGQGHGECEARPNYPSVHLSPQMSCDLTTPIALSTPRRSASLWRCCSQTRACKSMTRNSPLYRQLAHFSETPDPLLSLSISYHPLFPQKLIINPLDSVRLVSRERAALGKTYVLWLDQERYERHSFGGCQDCIRGRSKVKARGDVIETQETRK